MMAREAPRQSLKHGSTRIARLARWLDQPRHAATTYNVLRLEVRVDGEWSCMQAWGSKDVTHHLAETINELLCEYANEQGAYVAGRCVWWSEEHASYSTSYDVKVQPDDLGDAGGQAFSGDVQSTNIQTQRHLEFMMRQHMGGVGMALTALRETLGTTKTELLECLEELASLRHEVHELRAAKLELESQLEQALSRAEEIQAEKDEQEGQSNVIQLIASRLQTTPPKPS